MSADGLYDVGTDSTQNLGAAMGEAHTSTCASSSPIGDEEARLNAARLSLAERWRRALEEPAETSSPALTDARREEFWEAREISKVWTHAAQDPALLAILREEEHEALGAEPIDQAVLDGARARFARRFASELGDTKKSVTEQVLVRADEQETEDLGS